MTFLQQWKQFRRKASAKSPLPAALVDRWIRGVGCFHNYRRIGGDSTLFPAVRNKPRMSLRERTRPGLGAPLAHVNGKLDYKASNLRGSVKEMAEVN